MINQDVLDLERILGITRCPKCVEVQCKCQTTIAGMLKELYNDQTWKDLVWSGNPLLDLVVKRDGFQGSYLPVPIEYTKENK